MEQWEYMPTYLEANATKKDIKQFLKQNIPGVKNPPRFMVESIMPELNRLGEQGWELVHMEPVADLGKKGDVLFGSGWRWSNVYFCVFKRRQNVPQVMPVNENGDPAFKGNPDEPSPLPVAPMAPYSVRAEPSSE